jgi:Ca-activated chloride channel family protein
VSTNEIATSPGMTALIRSLRDRLRGDKKAVYFALWGAFGCLLGAFSGELLLFATRAPRPPSQAVCLLIDCSDSMLGRTSESTGTKLDEVKSAAEQFATRQDLSHDLLAVVGFGSAAHPAAQLAHDVKQIKLAISRLHSQGSTAMDRGLDVAAHQLEAVNDPSLQPVVKSILLFTDGQPDHADAAMAAADRCREQKIRLFAIGTGDADMDFLAEMTGDPALVFSAQSGTFGESFGQAEKAIYGSLVESSEAQGGFLKLLLRMIGWTALVAWGGSLALIAGQNRYVRRPPLSRNEVFAGTLGGLVAGLAAGAAGQLLYVMAMGGSQSPSAGHAVAAIVSATGRIVGWSLLGAVVGRGLAFFVPNLAPRHALMGGAVGGALAAVAFLFFTFVGDTLGRFVGAAILGASIGLMIALFEAAFREVWLEVRFGTREIVNVSVGSSPVKIGSDGRACTIYARGARPLEVGYQLREGSVECIDYATEKATLVKPGDQRVIGNLTVTVRSSTESNAARSATKMPGPAVVPPVPPAPQRTKPAPQPSSSATTPGVPTTKSPPPRCAPPPPPPPKKQP